MSKFSKWKVPLPGGASELRTLLRPSQAQCSLFEMRWTVPVPIPSNLAAFKIPTPLASCFRTFRSVALSRPELHAPGDGTLEACFDPPIYSDWSEREADLNAEFGRNRAQE